MYNIKALTGFFTGEHPTSEINFAELISLAALGKKRASESPLKGVSSLASACVFDSVGHEKPDLSLGKFTALLKDNTDKALPLQEDDVRGAFNLLLSGQAETDIKDTLLNLLKSIPRFPAQIVADLPNIFRNPTDLPGLPGFDVASKTVLSIIRPDNSDPEKNRIFRLAILVYARMNGVNIDEKNLMDLCDFLENDDQPAFTQLVVDGLETMKAHYGVTDIQDAAKKLHAISQCCMSKTGS
ncbi:MAG: hypothetical protein PHY16_18770 [Methylobacter sp.]|nr:hypothetical protein [Methylobacter sp.]